MDLDPSKYVGLLRLNLPALCALDLGEDISTIEVVNDDVVHSGRCLLSYLGMMRRLNLPIVRLRLLVCRVVTHSRLRVTLLVHIKSLRLRDSVILALTSTAVVVGGV